MTNTAFILAAGRGERLGRLTKDCPKPLVSIAGRAIIDYLLMALVKAGIERIVINTSYRAEQIQAYLGDGSSWGLKIHYSVESEPLETAGGIVEALSYLPKTFLLVNADIVTDFPFERLKDKTLLQQGGLVLVNNPPGKTGDFGIQDGLLSLSAQPFYTYAGIALLKKTLFEGVEPGWRRLAPVFQKAVLEGQLEGWHYGGHWYDAGTIGRLQVAAEYIKSMNMSER